jgi:hypothetical protein
MNLRFNVPSIFAAVALAIGSVNAAQGAGSVIDPTQSVAGYSQLELSQQWWQWALSIPAATNPLVDTTGAFALTNNSGPVLFVAGNLGGYILGRTINVQAGKPIFFPVLNNIDIEFTVPGNCFDPGVVDSLKCALDFVSPALDHPSGLFASLDWQNLLTYPSYRQTSTSFFDFKLPANNLFGEPAGAYPSIAVSDGYWVALTGLTAGTHFLFFGDSNTGTGVTITVVPEPHTYALMLAGLLVVGSTARLRSFTAKAKSV